VEVLGISMMGLLRFQHFMLTVLKLQRPGLTNSTGTTIMALDTVDTALLVCIVPQRQALLHILCIIRQTLIQHNLIVLRTVPYLL